MENMNTTFSIEKIVKTTNIDTPNTQINDHPLYCLVSTSIRSGVVKLVSKKVT